MSEETTKDPGVLAPGGAPGHAFLPGATTLDYSTCQEIQKVDIFSDQRTAQESFFHSGLNAEMQDENVSLQMMEEATPLIHSGNANFGFIFNKKLQLGQETSYFDKIPHFEKTRVCGKGAHGRVDAFRDSRTGLSFVRKRFKEGSNVRKEEVQSLIRLNHKGVVKVLALLCSSGTVDLLLQDAGHPLRDCLRMFREKGIKAEAYWKVVHDLAKQCFNALSYVHSMGICHLDIKPENLLVYQPPSSGSLVLVMGDFGSSLTFAQPMTFDLGLTPEYWAPELWQEMEAWLGSSQQHPCQFLPQASFDVYAMGLCVYFMTSHKHLLKQLEEEQKTHKLCLVDPQDLRKACFQLNCGNKLLVFQLLLMKRWASQVPQWATEGDKVFHGVPPVLLRVLQRTLDPNPDIRASADEAAAILSGGTEERPSGEVTLRTPVTVEDNSMGCGKREAGAPGQQWVEKAPIPAESQEAQGQLPAEVQHFQEEAFQPPEPQHLPSSRSQHYQQSMSELMKMWDKDTAGPSQPGGLAGRLSIPAPSTRYQVDEGDISVGSDSRRVNAGLAAPPLLPPPPFPVCQAVTEQNVTRFSKDAKITPGRLDFGKTSTGAGGLVTEVDLKSGESKMITDSEHTQSSVMYESGVDEKTKNDGWEWKGAGALRAGGEMSVDTKVMRMSGNLEALSMCAEPDDLSFKKPLSAVGGKGLGKRKAATGKGEDDNHKEGIGKVMASCSVTKSRSPGKALRRKAGPSGAKLTFVVASSSRPKPSTHTMPASSSLSSSPQAAGKLQDLVQLRAMSISSGRGQLGYGDGTHPSGRVAVDVNQGENSMSRDHSLLKKGKWNNTSFSGPLSEQPPVSRVEDHTQPECDILQSPFNKNHTQPECGILQGPFNKNHTQPECGILQGPFNNWLLDTGPSAGLGASSLALPVPQQCGDAAAPLTEHQFLAEISEEQRKVLFEAVEMEMRDHTAPQDVQTHLCYPEGTEFNVPDLGQLL